MRESRNDLLPNPGKRREQRFTLREKLAVQLTARTLERRFEARQVGPAVREGAELAREKVTILKRPQRHLRAPNRDGVLRRVGDPEFSGNLQRISKLLRRETNFMEALGHVNRSSLGQSLAEGGRSTRQPGGQRAPPDTVGSAARNGHRLLDQLPKLPSEPLRVEFRDAPQHLVAPGLPCPLQVVTGVDQSRFNGLRRELIRVEQIQRHVHFANAAEPARQPANPPLGLLPGRRGKRHRLTQPSGRDARAMQRPGVPRKRGRKVRFERPYPAFQHCLQIGS